MTPKATSQSFVERSDAEWPPTAEASLGGFFYDHLCTSSGTIVGIRYWVDGTMVFDRHPVFSQFLSDERFKFNQHDGYVDFVFDKKDVDAFEREMLNIETAQDFGGESVVKLGDFFGIVFNL